MEGNLEERWYFFPFYRLETKTENGFKLNPKYNDFYGLWLDSGIASNLFPNVTLVTARLCTVQRKGFWKDDGGCSVEHVIQAAETLLITATEVCKDKLEDSKTGCFWRLPLAYQQCFFRSPQGQLQFKTEIMKELVFKDTTTGIFLIHTQYNSRLCKYLNLDLSFPWCRNNLSSIV